MNWQLLLPLVVTVLLAAISWVVAHRLNLARDREAKHHELRLRYLIEAYRSLEQWAGRQPPYDPMHVAALETAVADIQLLGSSSQIEKLRKAISDERAGIGSDLNTVINALRTELRRDLGLPEVQGNVTYVRVDSQKKSRKSRRSQ